jgi:hypothetical protein
VTRGKVGVLKRRLAPIDDGVVAADVVVGVDDVVIIGLDLDSNASEGDGDIFVVVAGAVNDVRASTTHCVPRLEINRAVSAPIYPLQTIENKHGTGQSYIVCACGYTRISK